MSEFIFSCLWSIIVVVVATVYFVWVYIRTNRRVDANRERFAKEMAESPDIYNGPAGEPQWGKILPSRVDDYTVPRYVYENMVECTEPDPNNGRIVGYRISPTLVIHSRVKENVSIGLLRPYVERYGGSLLDEGEMDLFKKHVEEISELRQKAGDTPIDNVAGFWFTSCGLPAVSSYDDKADLSDMAMLILKR